MSLAVRKRSWLTRALLSACLAVTLGLVFCSNGGAAPSRPQFRSAHPQRTLTLVLSPGQRRELARHLREDSILRSIKTSNAPRATTALAAAKPFRRGDLFATSSGGVQEYTPTGQLVQTIPGTSGATALCFDPSGRHLILPGVGLFNRFGDLLPSNWASVPVPTAYAGLSCVADAYGNVYASSATSEITKYDLKGDVLQTYDVVSGLQFSMDLAPDECTMYISVFSGPQSFGGPFDVCTSTQESTNHWQLVDDLRVLPNWQVLRLGDSSANLVDSSGQVIQAYRLDPAGHGSFRRLALDPDGTSFWACCALNPADLQSRPYILNVFHVDISSGQILDFWPLSAGNITVYGPPLLGDADVNRVVDTNEAGRAEAFSTTARYSGQLTRIHLWVDSSSTAGRAIVGVYSDRDGRPGALQEQTTISDVKPGAWNYADMASIPVTAGQHYWIAILGPKDGGMLGFRDAGAGRGAEMSAQPNLTALPAHWSGAVHPTATGPLSAYGS